MADPIRPKRGRGKHARRIDWEPIRREYIYGWPDEHGKQIYPTYDMLAKKHGLAASTVHAAARRGNTHVEGNWPEHRLRAQEKLTAEVQAKRTDNAADKIVKMETRHMDRWSRVEYAVCIQLFETVMGTAPDGTAIEELKNPPRFRRKTTKIIDGHPVEVAMEPKDIKALVDVLKAATGTQRVIMGVPETRIGIQEEGPTDLLQDLSQDDLREIGNAYARAIDQEREKRKARAN